MAATSAHLSQTAVNLRPDPLVCVTLGTSCLGGARKWRMQARAPRLNQPSKVTKVQFGFSSLANK